MPGFATGRFRGLGKPAILGSDCRPGVGLFAGSFWNGTTPDAIGSFLDRGNLSPHGIRLLWRPELIWTHVVTDVVIGLACFILPVAPGVFLTKRRDVAFGWMAWAFAGLILACGPTHVMAIIDAIRSFGQAPPRAGMRASARRYLAL